MMPCLRDDLKSVRLSLWGYLGVVLITAVVLSPVLQHEFVAWDDDVHIYANPLLQPVSWKSLASIWREPYAQLYIPLTYTVWAGLAGLTQMLRPGPLSPEFFHAANLLLHLCSVTLVYRLGLILRRLHGSTVDMRTVTAAALGALVFGLHPVQVEAIAWASSLKDILCGFWSLVALWQYLAFIRTPAAGGRRRLHYGFASTAFVLALLAKPTAVVVPVLAACLSIVALGQSWQITGRALAGWIGVAGLWGLLTKGQQPDALVVDVTPWPGRLLVAADTVTFYLGKLLWPGDLGPDYGRTPQTVLNDSWVYTRGLLLAGIGSGLWWGKRHLTSLRLGSSLFVAGLLPVLGFIPFLFQGYSTVADRYLYLSLLGPALAIAWILQQRNGLRQAWIAGALVVALLGWRSANQVLLWRDTQTLFTHALQVNPRSAVAHNNLGLILARQGKLDAAIAHYDKALQLKPGYAYTHNNLGLALSEQNHLDAAIFHYREALRLKPDYTNARNNLGLALVRQGHPEQAKTQFTDILQSSPDATTFNNLGIALAAQHDYPAALFQFARALHLRPDYANAYHNLGLTFARLGRTDEAQAAFRMALRLRPDLSSAALSLVQLLAGQTSLTDTASRDAISLATEVCRVTGYRDATALYTLALAHQMAHQPAIAVRTAQHAINLARSSNNAELVNKIASRFSVIIQKELPRVAP